MEAAVANKTFEFEYAFFPIYIDGVIDMARYNVQEERFDQIEILVATEGIITSDMLPGGTAWCDKWENVIILLEEG